MRADSFGSRWLRFGIATFVVGVASMSSCGPKTEMVGKAGPRIGLERRHFEVGEIAKGVTPLKISVPLRNVGDEPLQIFCIEAGCSCISPTVADRVVAPGEATEIRLRIGATRPGQDSAQFTIVSNDATEPLLHLSLSWRVISGYALSPEVQFLETLRPGDTRQVAFDVYADEDDKRIENLQELGLHLELANFVEGIQWKDSAQGVLDLVVPENEQHGSKEVRVLLKKARETLGEARVVWYVNRAVTVLPASVERERLLGHGVSVWVRFDSEVIPDFSEAIHWEAPAGVAVRVTDSGDDWMKFQVKIVSEDVEPSSLQRDQILFRFGEIDGHVSLH